MMNLNKIIDFKTLQRALRVWGAWKLFDHVEEELAELLLALKHYRMRKLEQNDVIDEMADVLIMLKQLEVTLNCSEKLRTQCEVKYARFVDRLKQAELKAATCPASRLYTSDELAGEFEGYVYDTDEDFEDKDFEEEID